MRRAILLLACTALAACGSEPSQGSAPKTGQGATAAAAPRSEAVPLRAADGVIVHAVHYPAQAPRAVIILLHQAQSNKNEYREIAPRLAQAGFETLAIDQRSGGEMFGGRNATVDGIGRSGDYAEAKPDSEAALAWARRRGRPVILLGSSYSAALAIEVAAEQGEALAALMVFSPGEYLGDGEPVRRAAERVRVPTFVTAAQDPDELNAARLILGAMPTPVRSFHEPTLGGVHGASTLIQSRNPVGAEEVWKAVETFLMRVVPKTR